MQQARDATVSSILDRPPHAALSAVRALLVFAVVAGLYYGTGRLALLLLTEPEGIAVFWPASGIAAGALAVLGRRAALPIALAVAVATIAANLQARSSLSATAAFAFCNAAECLIFGAIVRRLDRSRTPLECLASVAVFLVAAVLGPAIAALPAALAIQVLGLSQAPFLQIWLTWFQSDALGIVAVAPMLLTLPSLMKQPPRPLTWIEGAAGIFAAAAAATFVFWFVHDGNAMIFTPTTLLFPVFLWLAARTPAVFTAVGALFVAVIAVVAALAGVGRFGDAAMSLPQRLAAAQVVLATTSVAVLVLAAMFARVKNTVQALESSEQRLRLALATGEMYAFDHDLAKGQVLRYGGLYERIGLPQIGTRDDYIRNLHPDDRPIFESVREGLSPAEPTKMRRLRLRAENGEELVIEYRTEGEFDVEGRLIRIMGTCFDVTELEQARRKLQRQTEQLSSALIAGRAFAFDYDAKIGLVERSDSAAEILGVPLATAKLSGNLFIDLVHREDRDALIAYGARKPGDDAFKSQTFRFMRTDGRMAWLEMRSTGTFNAEGKLISIRGLARDVTVQVRAAQRQEILVRELDHRVKNALARMAVVIELSRDGHPTLDDYVAVIQGRIGAMARTQERLSGNKWQGIGIATIIGDELAAYRTSDNCRIDGPEMVLEPDMAQALAFTVHELATNAAKYGALSKPGGKVAVAWTVTRREGSDSVLGLTWREITDGGIVAPTRESYGLNTIRNLLRYEQEATVDLAFEPTGLVCAIAMPLKMPPASREDGAAAPAGLRFEAGGPELR